MVSSIESSGYSYSSCPSPHTVELVLHRPECTGLISSARWHAVCSSRHRLEQIRCRQVLVVWPVWIPAICVAVAAADGIVHLQSIMRVGGATVPGR